MDGNDKLVSRYMSQGLGAMFEPKPAITGTSTQDHLNTEKMPSS